jgi:hypothetical protein
MPYSFRCSQCKGLLNPGGQIILRAVKGSVRGLFLFSPALGDYELVKPDDFPIDIGEEVSFECPLCNADMQSGVDDALAVLECVSEDEIPASVYFSRRHGTHATIVVEERRVSRFGEDAAEFEGKDFTGESGPDDG